MSDRLPTDVAEARLQHLIDRARRGALLPAEADQLMTGLRDLVRRLEDTEDERDRLTAGQCTHYKGTHDQRHTAVVTGCVWCTKTADTT